MGCFGYICRHCGKAIRGEENCVLIHVRHGEEIGRVEGHYDYYGRVTEQDGLPDEERFRGYGTGINSHKQICESDFGLPDSYNKVKEQKLFEGKAVDFYHFYRTLYRRDFYNTVNGDITKLPYYEFLIGNSEETPEWVSDWREWYDKSLNAKTDGEKLLALMNSFISFDIEMDMLTWTFYKPDGPWYRDVFDELPDVQYETYSGIVAYHKVCYNTAIRKNTFSLLPSEQDPDQSCGQPRKRFM